MVNVIAPFPLPKFGLCLRTSIPNDHGEVVAEIIHQRRGKIAIEGDLMAADRHLARKEEEAAHGS